MTKRTSPELQYEIGASIARRDFTAAAASAALCRATWPEDGAGWLFGSIVALLANDKVTALSLIDERLASAPADVQCLLQKAECLLALGRRQAALDAADSAATSAGRDSAALDAVGEFFVHAGVHDGALAIYNKALTTAPNDVDLLSKRAVVHRFVGNFDLAMADYRTVLEHRPANPEALKGLSELRRQTNEANSVAAMETALANVTPNGTEAATLHLALAKSYEDMGDHAKSWQHLTSGNQIERSRVNYDPASDAAVFERIIEAFPDIEQVRLDTTEERPIFIVGMPRTGTTLVERIIGSHSLVHSAGELPAFSEAVGVAISRIAATDSLDWPSFARKMGFTDPALIATEYLARSRARRDNRHRFSDKQPTNFYYCALIFRAFPNARIVHLTRHPLAACYAIYKTRFAGTYAFSYDLSELAAFYIGYRRLMDHWHRILPGRILDVAYEDVVKSQDTATRRILEYLDLPFEAACLDFHLNPASTATASAVQVRQPLYASSLEQWRHYATELAPLHASLVAAGISVAP